MGETELSLDDLRLLSLLEQKKSLSVLSQIYRRDKSVISRRLKELAEKSQTVEKLQHRWHPTELGRKLTKLYLDFESRRDQILGQKTALHLVASRLFVSSFLAPRIEELGQVFPGRQLHLLANDGSPEKILLEGGCDLALSCGKPQDPAIAYRRAIPESYFAVCSKTFSRRHGCKTWEKLQRAPHLAFVTATGVFPFHEFLSEETPIAACFNDPMAIFKALEAGSGWTVLPYYALEPRVRTGEWIIFRGKERDADRYGVWWLRSRKGVAPLAQAMFVWLSQQRLDPD